MEMWLGIYTGKAREEEKRLGVWQRRWPRGAISRAIRPQINCPISSRMRYIFTSSDLMRSFLICTIQSSWISLFGLVKRHICGPEGNEDYSSCIGGLPPYFTHHFMHLVMHLGTLMPESTVTALLTRHAYSELGIVGYMLSTVSALRFELVEYFLLGCYSLTI